MLEEIHGHTNYSNSNFISIQVHDGNLLLEYNFDTIFESELLTEVYFGQHNCLFNYMIIWLVWCF